MILLPMVSICWGSTVIRPAGKAFMFQGKLIVPLQDSSNGEYGHGIHFSTINNDFANGSPFVYLKTIKPKDLIVKRVPPSKICGLHTYNIEREIEVIDIKRRGFNLFSFFGLIIKKIFK